MRMSSATHHNQSHPSLCSRAGADPLLSLSIYIHQVAQIFAKPLFFTVGTFKLCSPKPVGSQRGLLDLLRQQIVDDMFVCVPTLSGDVPAQNPHHGSVQRVDAEEISVQNSVDFFAAALHRGRHCPGTVSAIHTSHFHCCDSSPFFRRCSRTRRRKRPCQTRTT